MSSEGIIEAVKKSKAKGFFGKLGSGWEGGQREKGEQEFRKSRGQGMLWRSESELSMVGGGACDTAL